MYSWISPKPYRHHNRFKVITKDLQGIRKTLLFDSQTEAATWIQASQGLSVEDGRPMGEVVDAYLEYLARLADSRPR